LGKGINRLGIPVKNEYRRIEYASQRIEDVRIGRLCEAEGSEGNLDPRAGITQEIKIFHCSGRVADI
jgi:hypothetical protein